MAIDTHEQPHDGDLVVAEAEIDGDSVRLARRYSSEGEMVRLEAIGNPSEAEGMLQLPQDSVLVLGIIVGRLRFAADATDPPVEEPL